MTFKKYNIRMYDKAAYKMGKYYYPCDIYVNIYDIFVNMFIRICKIVCVLMHLLYVHFDDF